MCCCHTGLTCVGRIWAALSLLAAAVGTGGLFTPTWIHGQFSLPVAANGGPFHETSFGSFRRCGYPTQDVQDGQIRVERGCGRYRTWDDIPSSWWRLTTALTVVGCGLAVLTAFVAAPACMLSDVASRTSTRVLGLLQILAAVSISAGCAFYPMGWSAREVRESCGRHSGGYRLGDCRIGHGFYAVLAAAGLLAVCALLSLKAGKPVRWKRLPTQDVQDRYAQRLTVTQPKAQAPSITRRTPANTADNLERTRISINGKSSCNTACPSTDHTDPFICDMSS